MSVDLQDGLTQAAVTALSQSRGEPSWMLDLRVRAFKAFTSADNPRWDRTDAAAFELDHVRTPSATFASDQALPADIGRLVGADAAANLIVQAPGAQLYRRLDPALEAAGVVFADLHTALREHESLVKRYFQQSRIAIDEDKATALHHALWTGGVFVYVPRGVHVEAPLQFRCWSQVGEGDFYPHVIIAAEPDSSITFLEGQHSEPGAESRQFAVVEVFAADDAQVRYGSIQDLDEGAANFTVRRGVAGRNAKIEWVLGDFGSRITRAATRSTLAGQGAESYSIAVFFGTGSQHLDTGVTMLHEGRNTIADMVTKGVLSNQARSVYRGMTDIERGAHGTSSFQNEKTLMLSADARADAIPGLEIDDSDVSASHSATTGQVDQNQLFYLMSRGLSKAAAVRLIVDGFLEPILSKIAVEGVRAEIRGIIDRKMQHA